MEFTQVYVVTGVPETHLEAILDAISSVGGGRLGEYTHCAFTNKGVGRFKPSPNANPHIGDKQSVNAVDEWRVETFCNREIAKKVVQAIKDAHPYEEPVVYILPLLSPENL